MEDKNTEIKRARRRRLFKKYVREHKAEVTTRIIMNVLLFAVVVYLCRDRYLSQGIIIAVLITGLNVFNESRYYIRERAAQEEEKED